MDLSKQPMRGIHRLMMCSIKDVTARQTLHHAAACAHDGNKIVMALCSTEAKLQIQVMNRYRDAASMQRSGYANLFSLLPRLLAPDPALLPSECHHVVATLDQLLCHIFANVTSGPCYQDPHILFVFRPEVLFLSCCPASKMVSSMLMCTAREYCLKQYRLYLCGAANQVLIAWDRQVGRPLDLSADHCSPQKSPALVQNRSCYAASRGVA